MLQHLSESCYFIAHKWSCAMVTKVTNVSDSPVLSCYPPQSPFMATLNRVTQIHTNAESYIHISHIVKIYTKPITRP